MAAILVLDGSALLALAEAEVVVLREAVDAILWVFAHAQLHSLLAYLEHFGVGEAELSVAAVTTAVAQAKVLGMCLEELADGHEPFHGVSAIIGFYAAVLGVCRGAPFRVLTRMGTPFRVVRHVVVAVAILDEWRFGMVQFAQLPALAGRNHRAFWCEPMDAELAFQKGEDAVHRASTRAAPNEEVVANGSIGEVLVVLPGLSRSRQSGYSLVVAYENAATFGREVGCDGQLNAAHLLDVLLQFLCSRLFRGGSIRGNDNLIVALSIAEKPIGRSEMNCREQQKTG